MLWQFVILKNIELKHQIISIIKIRRWRMKKPLARNIHNNDYAIKDA